MPVLMAVAQSFIGSNSSPVNSRETEIALVSNTTSGNVAKDNAIQINGHIANEVHNWNFKTLIINYYPQLASSRCAYPVRLPDNLQVETTARLGPNLSTADKSPSRKIQHCLQQTAKRGQKPTLVNLELQYLALLSSLNGSKGPVCGVFRADFQRNYISSRIVTRFGLRFHIDRSADTSTITAGEDIITPTRNYVALVTPSGEGSEQNPCRFYVVEHCLKRFDVLIGSDFITNLSSSPARQDEPMGSIRPIQSKT